MTKRKKLQKDIRSIITSVPNHSHVVAYRQVLASPKQMLVSRQVLEEVKCLQATPILSTTGVTSIKVVCSSDCTQSSNIHEHLGHVAEKFKGSELLVDSNNFVVLNFTLSEARVMVTLDLPSHSKNHNYQYSTNAHLSALEYQSNMLFG